MSKEPAAIVGVIIGIASAVLVFLKSFGIDISDDQQESIRGLVAVIAPLVAGIVIRQFVTPVEKAEDRIYEAYVADPATDPLPTL